MATIPWNEQYKHPSWQRKRLEVMEASDFKCLACDAADKQLHVHHKVYIKGRKLWEYSVDELETLCEDCHSEAHGAKDRINALLLQAPSILWEDIASLLAGFVHEYISDDLREGAPNPHAFLRGRIAWGLVDLTYEKLMSVEDEWHSLGPDYFNEALVIGAKAVRG